MYENMSKFIQITILSFILCGCRCVDRSWWRHATIYEIYLKSFKDSNGDGIGDLKGVTSKLDYFVDIGVDTIWITPFYPSSGADGGYDITDFYGVDPSYGTMEDLEELLREMKIRGLNFVMDLVINHSSDEHEWFERSIKKIDPYTDYYVWADSKGYDRNGNPLPPNNWASRFNFSITSSAWTWNEERNQYYFHQFGIKQPDLNLRNPRVKEELKKMMKFWLDKGVTAFRVDAPGYFMEDPLLRDEYYGNEDMKSIAGTAERNSRRLNHPDTFPFLNELYLFVRHYDKKNKKQRESAILAEIYANINVTMKYFGTKQVPTSHFPFNFLITMLDRYLDAHQMIDYLKIWLNNLPKGAASNWALGNHDKGRIHQRFNTEYNSITLPLVTTLPGTVTIYYGEEISQEELDLTPEHKRNIFVDRDLYRLPMQWDDSFNAGFTSADEPWLPVHPSYWRSNVEIQRRQQNSFLNFFKDLSSIRKTDVFKHGDFKLYAISKWVLAYTRNYHQYKCITVLNLGNESNLVNLHSCIEDLPLTLNVVAASPNSGFSKGEKFNTVLNRNRMSALRPYSSVVLANFKPDSRCKKNI